MIHDAWVLKFHCCVYTIFGRLSLAAPLKSDTYQGSEHESALSSPPTLLHTGRPRPLVRARLGPNPTSTMNTGMYDFSHHASHSYFAV